MIWKVINYQKVQLNMGNNMKKYFEFIVYSCIYAIIVMIIAMPIPQILINNNVYLFKNILASQRAIILISIEISTIIMFMISIVLSKVYKKNQLSNKILILSQRVTLLYSLIFLVNLIIM